MKLSISFRSSISRLRFWTQDAVSTTTAPRILVAYSDGLQCRDLTHHEQHWRNHVCSARRCHPVYSPLVVSPKQINILKAPAFILQKHPRKPLFSSVQCIEPLSQSAPPSQSSHHNSLSSTFSCPSSSNKRWLACAATALRRTPGSGRQARLSGPAANDAKIRRLAFHESRSACDATLEGRGQGMEDCFKLHRNTSKCGGDCGAGSG